MTTLASSISDATPASLTDDARVIINNHNMFIIQASGSYTFYIGAMTLSISTLSITAISMDAVMCVVVSVVMLRSVTKLSVTMI